jgi:hypothetical protein
MKSAQYEGAVSINANGPLPPLSTTSGESGKAAVEGRDRDLSATPAFPVEG